MEVTLHLPEGGTKNVSTDRPIVLLGPNGVGKTRFAVDLAQRSNADRISAVRQIGLADLPRQSVNDLKSNSNSAIVRQLSEYWEAHNEYSFLMAEALEEDKSFAQRYRDHHLAGETIPGEIIESRLHKITKLWHPLFPGRTLSLDYSPTVTRDATSEKYATARMSEGERTALYLITRILNCTSNIILVDEPEVHFHPLLAKHFWNAIEAYKKDTLFMYVTHDIPFALSRKNPLIFIVRSPSTFDEIDKGNLPSEDINTILGAASFSISATRLIFCEGQVGDKEHQLFSAWYSCPKTAVIPVGGCANVRQCVDVFNANHATKNVQAYGHIDRDDWSEAYLNAHDKIKPLPINEVEGIACFEPVFRALARYYGLSDIETRFNNFLSSAKSAATGTILNKHALNRAKLVLELKQQEMRNAVKPSSDRNKMRQDYLASVTGTPEAEAIFDQQIADLESAISGNKVLTMFPSKTTQARLPSALSVSADKAFTDICSALSSSDTDLAADQPKRDLKAELITALSPYFFSRTVGT